MDIEQARYNMVEQQIRTWEVLDQQVLNLLFTVKREQFVPPAYQTITGDRITLLTVAGGALVRLVAGELDAEVQVDREYAVVERNREFGHGALQGAAGKGVEHLKPDVVRGGLPDARVCETSLVAEVCSDWTRDRVSSDGHEHGGGEDTERSTVFHMNPPSREVMTIPRELPAALDNIHEERQIERGRAF